jgi:hypothetical protein
MAGVLQFPNKSETADCYIIPDASLAHNLFGTSPLIGHHGRAMYDAMSVKFFDTPTSTAPFLSGSKAPVLLSGISKFLCNFSCALLHSLAQ